MRTYNKRMDGSKVILAGHRGDRVHFPENTMPAMRAAVELGCDMIETDIHMTKDGHLILMHDRDVSRTTDGSGFIDEMTLEQIRNLDAGSWKDPGFAGTKVPTVEEFIEYISGTDLMVDWELKDYPMNVGDEHAFGCANKLVELIERYGMTERSMLNSFSERVLEYAADTWQGKFVIQGQGIHTCSKRKDTPSRPPETFFDWVCMYNKTPEHPAGLKVDYDHALAHDIIPCIYCPDEEEVYRQALELGCRMFTSDDPGKGMDILRKLGER